MKNINYRIDNISIVYANNAESEENLCMGLIPPESLTGRDLQERVLPMYEERGTEENIDILIDAWNFLSLQEAAEDDLAQEYIDEI